jgi:phytoene dehydrogenase-like protein
VIVGAGHNGLVAAIVLARAGLDVLVLERDEVIGGACRTERPFAAAPGLGASTGAYLLGPFPPELLRALDLDLPLLRRDPHYFLPTAEPGRSLLLGADADANRQALAAFTSEQDVRALDAMQAELTAMRDDLAPAWLAPPLPVVETAERYVRPALREVFVDLVRGSVAEHLGRFDFGSDLLPAMYAVTDAFPGLHGGWDTPGSGFNFLVHNLCRLPGADGTWMIVRGGMGTVTEALAARARAAGARIVTGAEVAAITTSGGQLDGIAVGDEVVEAELVLVNADPIRLVELAGAAAAGPDASRVADLVRERPGTTLKLNLALRELPRFTSLPQPVGQHRGTIHLLPDLDDPLAALRTAVDAALAGEVPERPPIEIYLHTAVDPSLSDDAGHHSGALFVQWVPNQPAHGTWDELADPTADRLLALVDEVAPGTSELVVDRQVLHPAAIEERFGITGGHIFHLDNSLSFTDRLPYRTATDGVYACGAGCHPAGSVIGAAGWNAAHQALADRGIAVPDLTRRPGA